MKYAIIISSLIFLTIACVPEKRVVGIYGTRYGDTMRVVDDHSWRIELEEPDTVNHKQFKYTTGRWEKRGLKLHLTVDSKSYGDYWECRPFRVGWSKIRRNMECSGDGNNYVFHRVNLSKIRRIAKKEARQEQKDKKRREEEKIREKIRELEEKGNTS